MQEFVAEVINTKVSTCDELILDESNLTKSKHIKP